MLRDLSLLDSRLITGTEVPLGEPFFSYDSQSIAYRTNDGLVRISVVGGVPILIDETAVEITGASWESGDRIIFSRGRGLWQIPAGGGPYEQIIETNGLVSSPQLLPDGDTVIYSATAEFGGWNNGQVFAATLSTGETRVLIERGSAARYLPTGHLVYVLEGTLFGRAFDASTLSFSGGPVVLVEGITQAPFGSANYSIAQNGTLVYLADAESFNRNSLLWVDRQGRETPITTGGTTRLHLNPRLSPNGTQLAFTSFARDEPDNQDIWVYDLARGGTPTRITRSNVFDWRPVWTPDGESLIYTSFRDGGGLYRRSADGTGPEVQLSQHTMNTHIPESVSRDGTEMVLRVEPESIGSAGRDLYRLQLDSDATPEPLLEEDYIEAFSALSPDGRWLAYTSDLSGEYEIYISPYPNVNDRRETVSIDGGEEPLWHPNGTELFYRNRSAVMSVSIQTEPELSVGVPQVLFTGQYWDGDASRPNYDIHPDGDRFLMMRTGSAEEFASEPRIIVVQNWFEELERLVPR